HLPTIEAIRIINAHQSLLYPLSYLSYRFWVLFIWTGHVWAEVARCVGEQFDILGVVFLKWKFEHCYHPHICRQSHEPQVCRGERATWPQMPWTGSTCGRAFGEGSGWFSVLVQHMGCARPGQSQQGPHCVWHSL